MHVYLCKTHNNIVKVKVRDTFYRSFSYQVLLVDILNYILYKNITLFKDFFIIYRQSFQPASLMVCYHFFLLCQYTVSCSSFFKWFQSLLEYQQVSDYSYAQKICFISELKEAFVIFDRDNDNKINMQELATVMRSIGFSPTQADLQAIQQEYGNRLLDIGEVQNVISRRAPPPETEDSVRDAFRIFDKDGTGYVSASELRHVLTHLGEKLSDEEVDEMIREADITGDGQVNYDREFYFQFILKKT